MKRVMSLALALILLLALLPSAMAADETELQTLVDGTAEYLLSAVAQAGSGETGGEWAVMALARSGHAVPDGYFDTYYASLTERVQAAQGILHKRKYTEYSRVVIALSAIGRDPTDVGGYNLLTPLGDFDKTVWQGLNGPIWALIALDSGEYEIPVNPDAETQATRQLYVDRILSRQLADGGFSLNGKGGDTSPADPDITAMALQALARYQDQPAVAAAVEKALDCLGNLQDELGGYASWGTTNLESCAQVVVALCELGVPLEDPRFVKNGHTLLENLCTYRKANGGFTHVLDGSDGDNQMSTEQGFYALVDALRVTQGKSSMYRMNDVVKADGTERPEGKIGLAGKDPAVTGKAVTKPGITFSDVKNSPNRAAIEELASREIINGMGSDLFAPDATMTRAQYAAIVVKALGLTPDSRGAAVFSDVPKESWFAPYVWTACDCGVINGRGSGIFDPEGTITKQEAAVMTVRAAKLCGLDTEMTAAETLDTLCEFGDYRTVADWAKAPLAYCYAGGLLDSSDWDVEPARNILRGEVAEMLYRMLALAQLL